MSASGKRAMMQVEPTRLVELAASSEAILAGMREDWASAVDELAEACAGLGDAKGALNVSASYADSLADAGEVVAALTEALGLGIAGLVEAAQDAVKADEAVAGELDRAGHGIRHEGYGCTPGKGGR